MATKLVYLEDFDLVLCDAVVETIETAEDGRTVLMLDQTCFYPRGGGQDWDTGTIRGDNGTFNVQEVRLDESGIVHHIGTFTNGTFTSGDTVSCQVTVASRQINTRLHSAGHLIDMALSELKPDWIPVRGGHYPHMCFVEYQVPDGENVTESFAGDVQTKLAQLTQSSYENQLRFMEKDEMAKYCRHVPKNLPINKPSRIVLYADNFGIPCGGTHVKNAREIGEIKVTKAKIKKGLAKISYAVTGIN